MVMMLVAVIELVHEFKDARQIIHLYHFQNIREGFDCGSES